MSEFLFDGVPCRELSFNDHVLIESAIELHNERTLDFYEAKEILRELMTSSRKWYDTGDMDKAIHCLIYYDLFAARLEEYAYDTDYLYHTLGVFCRE